MKAYADLDYWELREIAARAIPRMTQLMPDVKKTAAVIEKGRKSNYHEFKLNSGDWLKKERLLDTETINSFLEISLRAAACPMPMNADTWDGMNCPFGCRYCFADSFRASLYTSFFDNSKSMGLRKCNPDHFKAELDKIMPLRGTDPHKLQDIRKAVAMEIPIRFGIRFEDFLGVERKAGVSLQLLQYLKAAHYPTMINTKSDLVGQDAYLEALAGNPAGSAVHITMISCRDEFLSVMEPGAPSFKKRITAAKALVDAGVRVVARIEPYMIFINDAQDMVEEYIQHLEWAGVKNLTFDTYSYSAYNAGIASNFRMMGYDFERMFMLTSDSQGFGSMLLDKFMDLFRARGLSCSTFDMGNVPKNSQMICCEVGDVFKGGFNWGSMVNAAWYVMNRGDQPTSWAHFWNHVQELGGFLSPALEAEVQSLWNLDGNASYFINWSPGIEPVGYDRHGIVWAYKPGTDFRTALLGGLE